MMYMYLQDSSIMNHIIVLLEGVADSIDHKNIKTARKAFQALIELCAGNFCNQELAFRLQALASINSFLKIDPQSFDLVCLHSSICNSCQYTTVFIYVYYRICSQRLCW